MAFNFRTGNGQNRLCSFDVNLTDARTGDLNAVEVGGTAVVLSKKAAPVVPTPATRASTTASRSLLDLQYMGSLSPSDLGSNK